MHSPHTCVRVDDAVKRRDVAVQMQAIEYSKLKAQERKQEAAAIRRLRRMVEKVSRWEVMMMDHEVSKKGVGVRRLQADAGARAVHIVFTAHAGYPCVE